MALHNSQSIITPVALHGPILTNPISGMPRYWATVWASVDGARLAESTLQKKLHAIDALYKSVTIQTGEDNLDQLISDLNFNMIEPCISGFFTQLSNESAQLGTDVSQRWSAAFSFLKNTLDYLVNTSPEVHRLEEMHAFLLRLERLYSSLKPLKKKRPLTLRALPAVVVEDLYDIIEPNSPRNPFRTERSRWRNFILIILLLHQGLRRGEALLLPSDVIKEGLHPDTGENRYWINITSISASTRDDRSEKPSIKTSASIRQVPVAHELANLINSFTSNWRGKQSHPFLISNAQGKPLSLRYVGMIFQTISKKMSQEARQALVDDMREPKISAHDLRHTCAVVRLTHFLDSGIPMDEAVERLRAFFGWAYVSQMPRHYARAYFENRLAAVWQDSFDSHVEALRQLDNHISQVEERE